MSDDSFIYRWIEYFQVKLLKCIDDGNLSGVTNKLHFITKFSCNIKIKSILDELLSKIRVVSLITCLIPHWKVKKLFYH